MKIKTTQEAPPHDGAFLSESEILPRLGVSRRTIANWRQRGLPFVKLPGSRLLRYHWPSVENYLLRQQKGQA
jgi:phage terminase Nu1 subunit (DNA packaging protein)